MYGICLVWSGLVWSVLSVCLSSTKQAWMQHVCMYVRSNKVR